MNNLLQPIRNSEVVTLAFCDELEKIAAGGFLRGVQEFGGALMREGGARAVSQGGKRVLKPGAEATAGQIAKFHAGRAIRWGSRHPLATAGLAAVPAAAVAGNAIRRRV